MFEQLSGDDHMDMLNNQDANDFVRSAAYKGYIQLGFSHEKALEFLGFKPEQNTAGEAGYMEDIEEVDEETDINCLYHVYCADKTEEEAIAELSRQFNRSIINIKEIVAYKDPSENISSESYLNTLSTNTLKGMYAVLLRQVATGGDIDNTKQLIEQILAKRTNS